MGFVPKPHQIEIVDDDVANILRRKTVTERIALAFDACETLRGIVTGGVKHQNPSWTDAQIKKEVARRMLGDAARIPETCP